MRHDIFLLLKEPDSPCKDIIYHRDGTLRIGVYCLDAGGFTANYEEVQFFADDHGEMLVFETMGYNGEEPGLIIEAIRWYASYIQNPGLEILADDPRTEH